MPNATHNEETDAEFLKHCRAELERLDDIRLGKLRSFEFRKKIAVPVGAVMTAVLMPVDYWLLSLKNNDDNAVGLTILGLFLLWFWVKTPKRKYARAYKTRILPKIAALLGDFTYYINGQIKMEIMEPSKIIPYHSTYKSEDCFSGHYKGVHIHFAEIALTKQLGKNRVTVFQGLAVLLTDGAKKFYGHTILTRDQNMVAKWFKKKTTNFKRANIGDPEFERLFDIFTTDQVEARDLIDPLIIESIKGLRKEYEADKMSAAFYDGHVLILIGSSKKHFEPADIEIKSTNEYELLSLKREVAQILSIVDRLSLYDPRKRRLAKALDSN